MVSTWPPLYKCVYTAVQEGTASWDGSRAASKRENRSDHVQRATSSFPILKYMQEKARGTANKDLLVCHQRVLKTDMRVSNFKKRTHTCPCSTCVSARASRSIDRQILEFTESGHESAGISWSHRCKSLAALQQQQDT